VKLKGRNGCVAIFGVLGCFQQDSGGIVDVEGERRQNVW
jgi:hypothetical protein